MNKYVGPNQAIENQSMDIVTEFKANNIQYDEISDEILRIPFVRALNTTLNEETVSELTEDTQSVEVEMPTNSGTRLIPYSTEGVTAETPSGELSDSALSSLNQFINRNIPRTNTACISYDKLAGKVTYMRNCFRRSGCRW